MDTKALRQKILDLAIRGKLVPQDPNDEPASVLLQRIRAEKERLIAEGKIKRPKKSKASSSESHYKNDFQPSFPIPDSWQWVRLEDILSVKSGESLNVRDLQKKDSYPIFGGNGINGYYKPANVDSGTLIIGRVGFYCGCIHRTNTKAWVTDNALIVSAYSNQILIDWLQKALEWLNIRTSSSSTAQPVVSGKSIYPLLIPLPPLNEQRRIAKTLSQVMIIVSSLEKAQDNLCKSVIDTKSKILELAMQGKLVPQDPADEPAADMLRRVNPNARIITDTPHLRNLPEGWCETKLIEVANLTMGQSPSGESINLNDGLEFHQGKLYFGEKWIEESPQKTSNPTKLAKPLDILLCVRAPVGVVNFTSRHICIGRGLCAVTIDRTILNVDFAYYYLQYLKTYFENNATGSTFLAISGETVKKTPLLLPPLSEQQKIIERVEELYSVLDAIEASLQS